jgi:hypothetical protein
MANGGVSGPVCTAAEKAFSQMGLALLFNSTGEAVEVGTAVCVATGTEVAVLVGGGVELGSCIGVGVWDAIEAGWQPRRMKIMKIAKTTRMIHFIIHEFSEIA